MLLEKILEFLINNTILYSFICGGQLLCCTWCICENDFYLIIIIIFIILLYFYFSEKSPTMNTFVVLKQLLTSRPGNPCPLVAASPVSIFLYFRWLLISCWAEISAWCQQTWWMDWFQKVDSMGTSIAPASRTAKALNPSRPAAHYETLIKSTWKINWALFDSGKNRKVSALYLAVPPIFPDVAHFPLEEQHGEIY